MSVKSRMDKYWIHDTKVGRRILKEVGFKAMFENGVEGIDAVMRKHRLTGSMKRYARLYKRLNRRGHLAPIVEKTSNLMLTDLGWV